MCIKVDKKDGRFYGDKCDITPKRSGSAVVPDYVPYSEFVELLKRFNDELCRNGDTSKLEEGRDQGIAWGLRAIKDTMKKYRT